MTLSVRLEPALEKLLEEEARRLGITKSQYVKDTLERSLGMKNPAELLTQVRSGQPMGNPTASEKTREQVRKKLRANHPR
jgi:predicted DNA-binding protein